MTQDSHSLDQGVLSVASTDFTTLSGENTVGEALDAIRTQGVAREIVYFYVLDGAEKLVGVLPVRRLLTAPLDQPVREFMINKVVTLPREATVLDACELFVLYRFLAFPVVDDEKHMIGVVDVSLFTGEVFDVLHREQMDEVFESIGFSVSKIRDAGPRVAFRFRFPWLLATIGSGVACAWLASIFATTLEGSIALAFFLTLVLGLGESVSIQSMTVAIQTLHRRQPTWSWYFGALRREAGTALLLGSACGILVGLLASAWFGVAVGITLACSILAVLCSASIIGLSVPSTLHALKLDPKISAGPVSLALADMATLLIYFSLATLIL